MSWDKIDNNTWETRDFGPLVRVLKAGLATRPIYDLYVDGQAVRRCPKLNEAKAFAGPYVARMLGSAEQAEKKARPLVGAAAQAKANAKPKAAPVAKPCLCGCGEQTKGGTFVAGHDARYKSALIREALAGNDEAMATLEARGWTKFLDKARETSERRAARQTTEGAVAHRTERAGTDEDRAREALTRIADMKRACAVLKGLGRYGRDAGDRRISLGMKAGEAAHEAALSILDGTHPELDGPERKQAVKLAKEQGDGRTDKA